MNYRELSKYTLKRIAHNDYGNVDFFSEAEMKRRVNAVQQEVDAVDADALVLFLRAGYTDPNLVWLVQQRESREPSVFILMDGELKSISSGLSHFTVLDPYRSPYLQGREKELKKLLANSRRLAFLNPGTMDREFRAFLQDIAPDVEFVDLTAQVATLRAVKSPEEILAVQAAVDIHDKVFASLSGFVYPGRRERDIASEVYRIMERCGADFSNADGVIPHTVYVEVHEGNGVNTVNGSISQTEPIKWPGQIITENNWFQLCMHGHGPGGYLGQKCRNVYFKQPKDEVFAYWDYCVQAQDFLAGIIKPGVDLMDIRKEYNRWLVDALGCEADRAGCVRGLGVTASEYPNMDNPESPVIQENMVFMMQPRITKNGLTDMCQDTFVVEKNGCRCMSHFPRKVIVLL